MAAIGGSPKQLGCSENNEVQGVQRRVMVVGKERVRVGKCERVCVSVCACVSGSVRSFLRDRTITFLLQPINGSRIVLEHL